jgi:hypothetical protein
MGLFDGVKNFMGGASMVSITPTVIERQPPQEARFPVGDSVLKGQFDVTCEKDCTVLAHIVELRLSNGTSGGTPMVGTIGTHRLDHTIQVTGRGWDFPYTMTKGQVQKGSFLIHDVDIPKALATLFPGQDPNAVLSNPAVTFHVRITVDVKGSPFDPSIDVPLQVVPA